MARKFSNDDGNLNVGSIITSRVRDFSDINMLFDANPTTGDIYTIRDANSVKQSVRNLVLTNHYERPFRPRVGGNSIDVLFGLADPFTIDAFEDSILSTISNSEPRAEVLSINTDTRDNSIDVTIEFLVRETRETVELTVRLERLR